MKVLDLETVEDKRPEFIYLIPKLKQANKTTNKQINKKQACCVYMQSQLWGDRDRRISTA